MVDAFGSRVWDSSSRVVAGSMVVVVVEVVIVLVLQVVDEAVVVCSSQRGLTGITISWAKHDSLAGRHRRDGCDGYADIGSCREDLQGFMPLQSNAPS